MGKSIEIRSNILGDIAKIRNGVVFKEPATVVDELIQNCQRARATVVKVTVNDGVFRVVDNGVGCADPQAVFEKNTSAWGNEDEAFGEGFFSVFLLGDVIKVSSRDWVIEIDVLEMMETGVLDFEVRKAETYLDGFEVELVGERVRRWSYNLRSEVRKLGALIQPEVRLNAWVVEKTHPLSLGGNKQEFLVDNEFFKAVLTPERSYSTIDIFYEDRPVKEEFFQGASGRLFIKKGMITLKAPDRKEYIYDSKRTKLQDSMYDEVRNMYKEFIRTATDEELDTFADMIDTYVEVEDYVEVLGVSKQLFNTRNDGEDVSQEKEQPDPAAVIEMGKLLSKVDLGPVDSETTDCIEPESKRQRPTGQLQELVEKNKMLVWVAASEVDMKKTAIQDAEYYGFGVLYARNKLYERAFAHLGICHIDYMDKVIVREDITDRVGPRSKKEERFLHLMRMVEKHFNIPAGSIRLADLSTEMRHKETGTKLANMKGQVLGRCSREEGIIYIDRKVVDFPSYRAQAPDYPNITAHDYRVLMRVQNTLAHELSHLIYWTADNTLEHAQGIEKISRKLADIF